MLNPFTANVKSLGLLDTCSMIDKNKLLIKYIKIYIYIYI